MDTALEPETNGHFAGPNGLFNSASNSVPSGSSRSSSNENVSSVDKCMAVTVLYSYKAGKKVLFLEAGKDFVDVLLSLLTVSIGGIIKLLYGASEMANLKPDGAIFKVFDSVDRLANDDKFFKSKKSLLEPQSAPGFGTKLLEVDLETRPSLGAVGGVYYSCGMVPHCVCITKKLGRRCPLHGRKMQTLCRYVDGGSRDEGGSKVMPVAETGYVKDGGKFFITDNLEMYPSSDSLMLLQKLKVDTMGTLHSLDMFLGMEEILKLLKASLTSTTVLQDVFGKVIQERFMPLDEPEICRSEYDSSPNLRPQPSRPRGLPWSSNLACSSMPNGVGHFDSKVRHPLCRPSSNLNVQRPQPTSFVSRNLGCCKYDSLANDQESLSKPISSPYVTKKISAYRTLHVRSGDRRLA